MVAAVHGLQCAAMASNVAQFKDRILVRVWTGMRPRMPWCCPFCHRSGKISHHGRPRFCIGTRSQLYFDLWRKRVSSSDDEDDGWREDSSCDILTVSVLQVPRLLLVVNVLADTAEI
jgi:hypothetical protein